MTSRGVAGEMRAALGTVLAALGPAAGRARFSHGDPARTAWSYTPRGHVGPGLLEMDFDARKGFHQLLATALSRAAFAQAVTIMALEEVLDLDEGWRKGRHSAGYHLAVFGDPDGERLTWRIEGHHLSVTATLSGDDVAVGPLFLGSRPHRVQAGPMTVLAPLDPEETAARTLLLAMPDGLREQAVTATVAPPDISSGTTARLSSALLVPAGVPVASLPEETRPALRALLGLYTGRVNPALPAVAVDEDALHFSWLGGTTPGDGHYYRIGGPGVLIEYSNADGDHSHTVMRTTGGDFGHSLPTFS